MRRRGGEETERRLFGNLQLKRFRWIREFGSHLVTLYGDLVAEIVRAEAGGLQVGNVALPWTLG